MKIVIVVALLTGCASLDQSQFARASRYVPHDGGFTYEVGMDARQWRVHSQKIMEDFNRINGTCPTGFTVVSTKTVEQPKTALGFNAGTLYIVEAKCNA